MATLIKYDLKGDAREAQRDDGSDLGECNWCRGKRVASTRIAMVRQKGNEVSRLKMVGKVGRTRFLENCEQGHKAVVRADRKTGLTER